MSSPLAGKKIVNTRATHQAARLDDLIRARGGEPVTYPCIDIALPLDTTPLDNGLKDCARGQFDWLVITSQNTVRALAERLEALRISPEDLRVQVASVGPKTAETVRDLLGLDVALIPDEYVAEALAERIKETDGNRVFLPQSSIARAVLTHELRATGMHVTTASAYRTVAGSGGDDLPAMLKQDEIDAVIFTSSSTAHNFVERLMGEGGDLADLDGVCLAAIGPVTGAALEQNGLTVSAEATTYTLDGILDALEAYFTTAKAER